MVQSTLPGQDQKQHKVNIIWQSKRSATMAAYAKQRYTLSLHEKASLVKVTNRARPRVQ